MNGRLPPAEKNHLQLGYVRLTDSAPLIVAQELGLYERYHLEVTLNREVSWANVRDKLTVGALDAAQMLAPLPAMTTLGVSGIRVPMLTALTLSRNGNTVTLSEPLWHQANPPRAFWLLPATSTCRWSGCCRPCSDGCASSRAARSRC